MTTKTETSHAGGFLVSEANGSRSRAQGTLASGQDLAAGAVLSLNGGKYEAYDADESATQPAVAVLYDAVDASSADQDCVVIVRDAEVNEGDLVFADGMAEDDKDEAIEDLKSVGIIAR